VTPRATLSAVAGISFVYDLAIGAALLAAPESLAAWFGLPLPDPILFVHITGILLIGVGLGYLQPMRDPDTHRAYLWVFGPLLKGAGAAIFIGAYASGSVPASVLLFAASDGTLALLTLLALLRRGA
jgi:hypothetical protein